MATAYVIRKCDRTVTEAVIRGDIKQWHRQQFRFPVTDFAIIFALRLSVNEALNVSPSVPMVLYHQSCAPQVARGREIFRT